MRRIFVGGGVVFALAALLALDLLNQGLAWRAIYNVTGEESIPGQAVGFVQWVGRGFRAQPNTVPLVPVNHAGVNPFGVNVFLEQEAEVAKREESLRILSEMGFVWLRQEFPWEDIEIHGRGDFEDRRNDRDGDGEITEADVVSAWAKYDNIVDLVEQYDMRLQVRLSNPPSWTHGDPAIGDKAPPDDLNDYINYVTAVAERYEGRVHHYQVWNEPNVFPEWGNQDANPEAYTEMLCAAYDALKAVDEDIVVVSAALAPTVAMGGFNLNDYIFLQRMLDNGAGDCFDVLAMQGYGLNSGPTDRRMRPTTVNFARPMYIRDMLVRNGYEDRAIWISEAAWNPVPEPDDVPDVDARYNFGQVTEEQAGRYMVEAYERQMREWPWTGVTFYWFFKRAADFERNQSFYYFRMMEPDFTPLPVYDALDDYMTTLTPTLYEGVHQAEHWAVDLGDDAEMVEAEGAQFGQAAQVTDVRLHISGTSVTIRYQSEESIVARSMALMSGGLGLPPAPDEWREETFDAGDTMSIRSDAPWLLDSVTVRNDPAPVWAGIVAGVAVVLGGAGTFVWRRVRRG